MVMRKRFLSRVGFSVSLSIMASGILAQGYPAKPVKVYVPYGPGTGVDVVARLVSEALARSLGQAFVIDNRPGAGGTIATALVAAAPPDGYSVLVNASSHTSVPALMRSLPYDAARDFAGVTILAESPLVLITSKSRGLQSVSALIAAAKAKPGSITFASAGVGTATHIAAEKFRLGAGFDALHVPFKSTTDAIADVMTGRIDYLYTALVSALGGIHDGRLVALAMGSRRSPLLPNVPTIVEAGVASGAYSLWFGMFAPAKTPRDIVNRLNREIVTLLATSEMKERLAKIGAEPLSMTPEEFDALIRREIIENERLIKAAGIKTE
jgi:tripartite-type tricarboxylate transporter receptor subunit TctC